MFPTMASSVLSTSTFDVPLLTYLRNRISCFKFPKETSAWILRFILKRIPSSKRIRSKSSCLYFRKILATWGIFALSSKGVLQWFPLILSATAPIFIFSYLNDIGRAAGDEAGWKRILHPEGIWGNNWPDCERDNWPWKVCNGCPAAGKLQHAFERLTSKTDPVLKIVIKPWHADRRSVWKCARWNIAGRAMEW